MTAPDELTAPLTEAVALALREMAGIESDPREPGAAAPGEVSAVLPVTTAAGEGFVALSFAEPVANELARRVLLLAEAPVGADPSILRDCLGEVVNVVAGQAKTLLFGTPYHFTLSTPRVQSGAPTGAALVLQFGSEIGDFALRVYLPA
jgi:chemotaxis protein CheX